MFSLQIYLINNRMPFLKALNMCYHIIICSVNMGNITLSIPKEVHEEMRHFSEVKWSEVARKAVINKLETLKIAENLAKKSKLTKKDVEEFSRKIKLEASKRFLV